MEIFGNSNNGSWSYSGEYGEKRKPGPQNNERGIVINISQYGLLGEGQCVDLQRQLEFNLIEFNTLVLCHLSALNTCDKFEESGKRFESLAKIIQGLKEDFTDFFLQRLISTVNRIISDSEVRQILI